MLELSIGIEGKEWGDLELALQEITNKIIDKYRSGIDSNDTADYSFKVKGEEEEVEMDQD